MPCVKDSTEAAPLLSELFAKHFLSTYCVPGPTLGMRNTERIMGQSLLSRSFQPRGRSRDVTQKGQYKEMCRVLWESWKKHQSPWGKQVRD